MCALTDLKPHVLRYWESQFRFLNPAKNRSGNRVYKGREVELIMLVKHLLYTEKFTIDGRAAAGRPVPPHRRAADARRAGRSKRSWSRSSAAAVEAVDRHPRWQSAGHR